jgi:hypothetical protein
MEWRVISTSSSPMQIILSNILTGGTSASEYPILHHAKSINVIEVPPSPSAPSQLAAVVRAQLLERSTSSGSDLVQSISGVVGAMASVIGSVATVALWMRKRKIRETKSLDESGFEMEHLETVNGSGTNSAPPSRSGPTLRCPRENSASSESTVPLPHAESQHHVESVGNSYLEGELIEYHYQSSSQSLGLHRPYWKIGEMDEQHDQTKIQLEARIRAEKQKRKEIEIERDNLLRLLADQELSKENLQKERFKVVLQDLLGTCSKAELNKQRIEFETIVEAEIRSRVSRQTSRLEKETRRQKHNRGVQDALQESLEQKAKDLQERSNQLGKDLATFSLTEANLTQAQEVLAIDDAKLRYKAEELGDIQQVLTGLTRKQAEKMSRETKKLASMAKDLHAREEKWKSSVQQRTLELTRRESNVKEREEAVGRLGRKR